MQVSNSICNQLIRAIAPSGNLLLLLVLPELRRQGLTFTAFYALQRVIQDPGLTEYALRRETGLPAYEVSRACKFLVASQLLEISRLEQDRRIRVLQSSKRGIQIRDRILRTAAKRLQAGWTSAEDERRLSETLTAYSAGDRKLFGRFQLSFFDVEEPTIRSASRPRKAARRAAARVAVQDA